MTGRVGVADVDRRPPADALYLGHVRHRRFGPVRHEFRQRMLLAYLDVDALPGSLDRLPLWSARRVAPIRFRQQDYFDGGEGPLGDGVRDLVADRLGRRPSGPVFVLTQTRTLGWLFNPITTYFCFDEDGVELDTMLLEVTNTPWADRGWYALDARSPGPWVFPKELHVSPYLDMEMTYRFGFTGPGPTITVHMDVERDAETILDVDLALRRHPLDPLRAVGLPLRYPFMPLRVSSGIYRQALSLRLLRVPVHRRPGSPAHLGAPR